MRLIENKIVEVERLVETCKSEMIEMSGTRDQLIRALLLLFHELGPNDSWTSITTPSVWQEKALGLDGRYATATVQAIRRGAAVHRTFIVSIEELGLKFANQLVQRLEEGGDYDPLVQLAKLFRRAIREFETDSVNEGYVPPGNEFVKAHKERFVYVVESLRNMIVDWDLKRFVATGKFGMIEDTKGLYLGLLPVSTLNKIWERRAANPVSLMYTSKEEDESNKWLLVMTEIRGAMRMNVVS